MGSNFGGQGFSSFTSSSSSNNTGGGGRRTSVKSTTQTM